MGKGRLHPNVLKASKQRRGGRRAYLKKYAAELVHGGSSVSVSDIPQDQLGYFAYRARGDTYWDAHLEAKFPSRGMIGPAKQEAIRKARIECVNKLNTLTSEVSPELNVVVKRGGITKTIIRLYYSNNFRTCFFMKEDWIGMFILKSMDYCGSEAKDRAYFDLAQDRIPWVERVDIPTSIPDDPPSG